MANLIYFCDVLRIVRRFYLELTVFLCGMAVMAFEIVGARVLGPYVGASMFVWSSIIGVILLSLSIGYVWGGRLADKRPGFHVLGWIILISCIAMALSTLIKEPVLHWLTDRIPDVRIAGVSSSLILFSVPAVLLGMVSPFAARLKITSLKTSGSTVGYLYAISTLGSITGTLLAGFFLIPWFRISNILYTLSVILLVTALLLFVVYGKTTSAGSGGRAV